MNPETNAFLEPFGNFTYFGLLLIYVAVPAILLGLFGRANSRWALFVTVIIGTLQLQKSHEIWAGFALKEVWIALIFLGWQWLIAIAFLRFKFRGAFPLALTLATLPVALAKYVPPFTPHTEIAFLGISYVTFRALDVVFSIRDRVVTSVPPITYIGFLFFFPTISEGPIDRFRRFSQDWQRTRNREEFLNDLDHAIQRLFRGFLYKFIIASLIFKYFVEPWSVGGAAHVVGYMYAYTFYLFFDFAGYSAFAISISYLLGIHTVENFNKPFLSPNIRDFWTRWHISLSFWFRDHIYMRFLLAAAKGKWFKSKHTASYVGLFLTFGLMGVWHGPHWYYWLYGIYHAALLCGYDWFARWNKTRKLLEGPVWKWVNILITFHVIAFGLLLFSGRFEPKPLPEREEVVDKLTCQEIAGYVWNRNTPKTPAVLDISMDGRTIGRVTANELRDDLVERGMGNGRYGFHFALPKSVHDGKEHWVMPVLVGPPPRVISGPDIPENLYKVSCNTPEKEGANPTATPTPPPATPVPTPR
ncbi:membrane bound O-acyl transferase MBOAT family protein [Chthoniobacter flavus Ellin428]|uniref:Membrane bound O-acyl transferase MBOAT family protein n=1 Tax=Chthoniobacter flavus Ellin428 TaxID=497964 RepID=B4D0I9_9BACT|nr:D-alanyl-lipoteichoic acid biosynthesis protein DltB [Chthoniobacter flavus]EDY19851.1 membrane bound O-acyl transferase MBOAT family protein [Chthoniobacter flavus Ellin428]TCO91876.1 membrane protein involved in D-alanine export [Chthoniobacter flavus]